MNVEEEKVKRLNANMKLFDEVMMLYGDCTDEGVAERFNPYSDKMLKLKKNVLTRLNNGESPEEIGEDYEKILEGQE